MEAQQGRRRLTLIDIVAEQKRIRLRAVRQPSVRRVTRALAVRPTRGRTCPHRRSGV